MASVDDINRLTSSVNRPCWKFPPSRFRPTLPDTPLGRQLNRYSPFQTARTEDELTSFLFGEPEGFWSGHPLFQMTANRPETVEVIIGQTGAGKTAFAHGLAQTSEAVNSYPYTVLPVYIPVLSDHQAVSHRIRQRLDRAVRQFIEANPALSSGRLTLPETENWLDAVPDILDRLAFNQVLLLIDFNEHNSNLLDQCLDHLDKWRASGLVAKLFVPDSAAEQLSGLSLETNQLGWYEAELKEMAEWRFDSVARKIDAPHLKLESLFELPAIYRDFLMSGLGNPGRLARLWSKLVEVHRQESPDRGRFTLDNLVRAVEQTQ